MEGTWFNIRIATCHNGKSHSAEKKILRKSFTFDVESQNSMEDIHIPNWHIMLG